MEFFSILFTAIGLSADCFAVALGAGTTDKNLSRLQILRVSFFFGFFQALMPLIGWLAGRTIVEYIEHFDHWVAFALLVFVGGKMLWEAFHDKEKEEKKVDISRGWMLLTLSIATSLDALAVGLSFAFLDVNIWLAITTIGVTAFIISAIGFVLGKKVGKVFGKRAEIIGGIILLVIGLRILLTHLL
jgi:manganese efflux pump family protein